ncbi:MAG: ABC transporter ATP-binding protein [Candidatus Hydrogenedentota bacterium]|nr:MAG: ABC transporter ATP-binding protein [Candidatus Hydrogenedentota bacterium]
MKEMLVEVRNLTKVYLPGQIALRNVDFSIREGEVLCIAGLNGAGKTTALKALLGLIRPTEGAIDFPRGKPRFGFLPEETELPPELTGGEIVRFSKERAATRGVKTERSPEEFLEMTKMKRAARLRVLEMSKGMRRRVALAAVLASDPTVLILDEPQAGLDPLARLELGRLLRSRTSNGRSVLFASHDLTEVEEIGDRILIFHQGRIVDEILQSDLERPGDLKRRFFERIGLPEEGKVPGEKTR